MALICVSGSRLLPLAKLWVVAYFLDKFDDDEVTLIHGGCPVGEETGTPYKGADGLAQLHAERKGWNIRVFPNTHGQRNFKRGFYLRNKQMIDEEPDVVLTFFMENHRNVGTQMTYDLAKQKDLYVVKVNVK